MGFLICISKRVHIFLISLLIAIWRGQSSAFLHFSKAESSVIYTSCLEAQSESWFPEWNLVFSATCAYLFLHCRAAAEHCLLCYWASHQDWAASIFFFLLIALYWGEKEGTRQIIQGLTPTRRGNVPGSLSTDKQAFRGILIFIDAPCFPSLYYTYIDLVDSYHQVQCKSLLSYSKGFSPRANTLSFPFAFSPLVLGQDFVWNLI